MRSTGILKTVALLTLPVLLAGCELGSKQSTQTGYRGAGLQQTVDPDNIVKASAIPAEPYALPADVGPKASESYKNVQVLGDLSTERFNHLMAAINTWVVPANAAPDQQGCNYCHNPEDMASDEKYTKVVARQMLQMTQGINAKWATHVKGTGVTCWTCHRGKAVPDYHWTTAVKAAGPMSITGNRHGQNTPDPNVGFASLPYDPFDHYLRATNSTNIRVASDDSYPSKGHKVSLKDAESSYGLMMHVSQSLGVNCTYCHNSQSFRAWNLSSAQRSTAYYGIRMVRDINADYLASLAAVLPANRKGPNGDVFKANCATCHQGQSKPMGGVSMLAANPALKAPAVVVAAPAPAVAPTVTADAVVKPVEMAAAK